MKQMIILVLLLVKCLTIANITVQYTQPHNKNCYTQGLFFLNDTHLFQTCGLYGKSYFHVIEYQSTPFELREVYSTVIPWKKQIFFEGGILFKGYIYILTWMQNIVYKLDPTNFQLVQQLKWDKEGWGLTTNGTHMFTTDGSAYIYLVDENFKLIQQKLIRNKQLLQRKINQLEFVNGYIYANIYGETRIVKIDYQTAKVVAQYDGSNLLNMEKALQSDQVLNGIAYNKKDGKFIMTGKDWGKFYQVKLNNSQYQFVLSILFLLFANILNY